MEGAQIGGLEPGGCYAMKILVPPSGFSRVFRDMLYWVGFQGPFQLQVNPAAARAGALWQKIIRRAARVKLGEERAVVDIYGTFVDERLGSCGELSEWVEGRTWRLEVDDRLDLLRRWRHGKAVDAEHLGSPEYRAKKAFMQEFVGLLHEMGAYEFARQYEWSTCKSQPNCLKRQGVEEQPAAGLVAVDFRAGLALLPFLPMSPGDVKLILQGLGRGSLVQFDRGNLDRLDRFVAAHSSEFADMQGTVAELKAAERVYRDSVPDITHNHLRLLYSGRLWGTMFDSAVTGWKVRNQVDERCEKVLRKSRVFTLVFLLVGCIPFLGKVLRRAWGRADWRAHYGRMLTSLGYLGRAFQAKIDEQLVGWHRAGRVDAERAVRLADRPWRFFGHWPLSFLPAGLHRFLTDWGFARYKLAQLFVRPLQLYFNAKVREQWLRDMLAEGQKKHMLSGDDAGIILRQLGEPFIQKYLKSLAVHICCMPVTHVVAVAVAIIYVLMHPEMPRAQSWAVGVGIIALFQVVPDLARIANSWFLRGLPRCQGAELPRLQHCGLPRLLQVCGVFGVSDPDDLPVSRLGSIHGKPLGDGGGARRSRFRRARGVAGALGFLSVLQLAPDDPTADGPAGPGESFGRAPVLARGGLCRIGRGCIWPWRTTRT